MNNKCPKCGNPINLDSKFCISCGEDVKDYIEKQLQESGKLTLSRKKSFYSCAVNISITIDEDNYSLSNGESITVNLTPGTHIVTYKVWNRRKKEVTIEVEKGRDYLIAFAADLLWGGFKVGKNSRLS